LLYEVYTYKASVFLLHFFVCWQRSLTAPKTKKKSANGFFDFEMSQVTYRYTSDGSKPDRSERFAL
jgi:hypothetical protein